MPNSRKKLRYRDEYEEPFINIPVQKLTLYLLLFSLTILFISFSIGYIYTRFQEGANGVYIPPIFIANSILLLASSWTINLANKAYKADDTRRYQWALWGTFLLTLVFLGLQIIGWTMYFDAFIGANIGNGRNYLYAISGLHFAHVIGGLPFLLLFMYSAYFRMKEPVSVLVYFSDPNKLMRLQLLTVYWHFLDGLWLFLVGFFLLNMLW